MNIEDELRQLFKDDERLDLHVSSRAEETVVRGAQRRRQRRGAAAGAFALVALVGAGVGLVQLRHYTLNTDLAGPSLSTSAPSTSTPPPSTTVITETVTVSLDPPPTGGTDTGGGNNTGSTKKSTGTTPPPRAPEAAAPVYNKLTLAMTEADALKTGMLVEGQFQAGEVCKNYAMTSVSDPRAVVISAAKGIVRITLPEYAKTSRSIGTGTKVSDVKAAYPTAVQNGSEVTVQMNTAPKWFYVFETDGTTVKTVRMRLADSDCPSA
ncbi:hypothetical protein [Nocardia sp. NRRL S-836]|uniref:hypothetical protein n=1 Tax=Nocardia sp. NRRL S-836 TaxID=1519492 RepID=UPI0006AFF6F9|nr:hypothetical protein [Nocardia sp. NRRL S-836]KOV88944.1 hypothetical protein ADL03_04840 [Nocardia sp. NRRL S-836]